MRIFHFTDFHFGLSDIALRRLKIARINELNDPFDFLGLDLTEPHRRTALERSKDDLAAKSGLLCFSRTWRNPLMWSHYADKHRGLVLGFDVADNQVAAVRYSSRRSENLPTLPGDAIRDWLAMKYDGWSYEEELRVFCELDHTTAENGLYFTEFSENLALREVILGPLCDVPCTTVQKLVDAVSSGVTVKKAQLAHGTFDIVSD